MGFRTQTQTQLSSEINKHDTIICPVVGCGNFLAADGSFVEGEDRERHVVLRCWVWQRWHNHNLGAHLCLERWSEANR